MYGDGPALDAVVLIGSVVIALLVAVAAWRDERRKGGKGKK